MLAMDGSTISGGAGGGAGRLTVKEGDQLLAGALGAQRKGNGREAVDGIESEQDVVVLNTGLIRGAEGGAPGGASSPPYLQFVDQHGDGVELVVGVGRVSHGGRLWRERKRARLSQEIWNRRVGVLVRGDQG